MTELEQYDEVPWTGATIPASAPERSAVLSSLSGGPRPRLRGARVLELGCADGANLTPLAFYDRSSSFLGIDRSKAHIDAALEGVEVLGLDNLRFEQRDFRDLKSEELGVFDFIIAFGLYSWVDEASRERLLERCHELLAPSGLLTFNLNVDPGWRMRGLVREIMLSRVGELGGLRERTEAARELAGEDLQLLEPFVEHPYCALLRNELELFRSIPLSRAAHDHLEADNHAFAFDELERQLERHGLIMVAEAPFQPADVARQATARELLVAEGLGGVDLELGVDLVCNRQLRSPIVCHVSEKRAPGSGRDILLSEDISIECPLRPEGDVELSPGVEVVFGSRGGLRCFCADPLLKALLLEVSQAEGATIGAPAAIEAARRRVVAEGQLPTPGLLAELRRDLFELYEQGLLTFRLCPAESRGGGEELVNDLWRFEERRRGVLTTSRHDLIQLDDFERLVVSRLRAGRSEESLIDELVGEALAGKLTVMREEGALEERSSIRAALVEMVQSFLAALSEE